MQDNQLWTRHLLTFAQQAALAVYDVARSPWPDRRLIAAVALMFLSGCVKYAERTACLAAARPERLAADFLAGFEDRVGSIKEMQAIARDEVGGGLGSSRYLSSRAFTRSSLNPAMDVMSTDVLPSYDWSASRDIFSDLGAKIRRLGESNQKDYFLKAYRFADERLYVCYQRLYTKALFRLSPPGALLHLVAFLSTSAATVLFYGAVDGGPRQPAKPQPQQRYGRADVAVSYVLLAGAVALEVSSFVLSMLTRQDLWSHPALCSCVENSDAIKCVFCLTCSCVENSDAIKCVFCLTCGNCAHLLRRWRPPRHWSETLAQYSVMGGSAREASAESLVPPLPRCVAPLLRALGVELDAASMDPVPVTDDLKLFLIEKLLGSYVTPTANSDFTGSRRELEVDKWMGSLDAPAGSGAALRESLRDVDFPTSVLVWHIATDVCFFNPAAAGGTAASEDEAEERKKIISRQLSNYIMYIVFKCGVMRGSSSQFLLLKSQDDVLRLIGAGKGRRSGDRGREPRGKKKGRRAREEAAAVERLLESGLLDGEAAPPADSRAGIEVLSEPVLPRAFKVAAALDGVRGRQRGRGEAGSRWDLITGVWLEMLFHVAPRCGAAFHREHLCTGGELVTHVLVLMYVVGPLGYHPTMLAYESFNR